jgi:hypothetical protein
LLIEEAVFLINPAVRLVGESGQGAVATLSAWFQAFRIASLIGRTADLIS